MRAARGSWEQSCPVQWGQRRSGQGRWPFLLCWECEGRALCGTTPSAFTYFSLSYSTGFWCCLLLSGPSSRLCKHRRHPSLCVWRHFSPSSWEHGMLHPLWLGMGTHSSAGNRHFILSPGGQLHCLFFLVPLGMGDHSQTHRAMQLGLTVPPAWFQSSIMYFRVFPLLQNLMRHLWKTCIPHVSLSLLWSPVQVPLKPVERFPSVKAFSIDSNRSWVRRSSSSARASQGRAGGCFWKIRLSACCGEVRRDHWGSGNIFVMHTKGLPQTPAPSSGMMRPCRNEEVLTHRQKQSWNVKSSLFPIKVSHALWTAAVAGCRDCLPFWCLLGGLSKAKGIGRSCSLQAVAESSCFSVISTGPASIMWHTFLMSILITYCLFLWCRLSSAWAQKGRWDFQESKDSCVLMGFSLMMDNPSFLQAFLAGEVFLNIPSCCFSPNCFQLVHIFSEVRCPKTRWDALAKALSGWPEQKS